jgi:hypothetical protein
MEQETKVIFWKDGDFEAEGGCFVRNPLFEFFRALKKAGREPVGIIVHDDWNLEIILKKEE